MFSRSHSAYVIPLMITIVLVGAGAMYWLIYAFPMDDESMVLHTVYAVVMIVLGLAIPYWVLKLGIHRAHLQNPQEKEMELSDIPKDRQDMARK